MRKKLFLTIVIAALIFSAAVDARHFRYSRDSDKSDFAWKFGYFMPSGNSDLWDYNSEIFLFEKEDLNSFSMSFSYNYHMNDFMTFTLEAGVTYGSTYTQYADYEDEYGLPIETDIELSVIPIEFSIKMHPIGRGHRVGRFGAVKRHAIIPYFGVGVGVYMYNYLEFGDYIDFANDQIIYAEFESFNVGVGYFFVAGIEIPMGRGFGFLAEYKHAWVKAPLSEDFLGFEKFDLGGQTINVGFTFGF